MEIEGYILNKVNISNEGPTYSLGTVIPDPQDADRHASTDGVLVEIRVMVAVKEFRKNSNVESSLEKNINTHLIMQFAPHLENVPDLLIYT